MKPKIISDAQVVKSYKMIELIDKIETVYKLYAEGKRILSLGRQPI